MLNKNKYNLNENMISPTEIGKMKLERTLKKVCFIAPKVYLT